MAAGRHLLTQAVLVLRWFINGTDVHPRAPAERANAKLKSTFKALRRVAVCRWRIGHIVTPALVILTNATRTLVRRPH